MVITKFKAFYLCSDFYTDNDNKFNLILIFVSLFYNLRIIFVHVLLTLLNTFHPITSPHDSVDVLDIGAQLLFINKRMWVKFSSKFFKSAKNF